MQKIKRLLIILFLISALLISCGGDSTEPEPKTINISINNGTINFGITPVGNEKDTSFVIMNQTESEANLTGNLEVSGSEFSLPGNSDFDLSPGSELTVPVRYSPTAVQSATGAIQIHHNATNEGTPLSITLNGNGRAAIDLNVTPSSLDFGIAAEGESKTDTVVLLNESDSGADLKGNVSINGSNFEITNNVSTFILSPGNSQNIIVQFTAGTNSTYSGTLIISHNATNEGTPLSITLNGNGRAAIDLNVTPSSLDFGIAAEGESKTDTVVLLNESDSGADLKGNVSINGSNFEITNNVSTFILSPGNSQNIIVQFTAGTNSTYSGTLIISHNAENEASPLEISLSGNKDQTATVENHNQDGWQSFTNGDYSGAENDFTAALEITQNISAYDSLEAEAQTGRGFARAFNRDFANAKSDFINAALHENIATNTDLNIKAGFVLVHFALNEYEDAIIKADELLSLKPDYIFQYDQDVYSKKIRLISAQSHYSLGQFEKSAEQLDIIDPDGAPHSTDPEILLDQIQEVAQNI